MRYVGSRELKKILGVTNQTVYNWRKAGKILFKQVNKRNFVYDIDSVLNQNLMSTKKVVAYCRVSNSKQKDDLIRQEESIREYARVNGIKIDNFYSEIASGMNEDRKFFNKIIEDVCQNKISKIYITYKDRLTRFGFKYFERFFEKYGCEIIVLNSTSEITFEQELTQDLISIIHHFSMKMYSNRRQKFNGLAKEIENEDD